MMSFNRWSNFYFIFQLTFLARNLDLMADLLKLVRPVPDQLEVFRIAIINGFETDENLAKNILALVKEVIICWAMVGGGLVVNIIDLSRLWL